jgi:hypothetical protein
LCDADGLVHRHERLRKLLDMGVASALAPARTKYGLASKNEILAHALS